MIAIKNLDFNYYNSLSEGQKLRLLKIIKSGLDNRDSYLGCYAMNPDDYDTFKPFFQKVLAEYHKVPEEAIHINNWDLNAAVGLPEDGKLDLRNLGINQEVSMRVRIGRNLIDFPLPGAMTKEERMKMEEKMSIVFDKLISMEEYSGEYYSLTPGHKNQIQKKKYLELIKEHIIFKDTSSDPYLNSAGISRDWPFGRGCYASNDKQFIIWIGEEDHLRIICINKGYILNDIFERLKKSLDVISKIEGIKFAMSPVYGAVTSCPTNLGTGMRASVNIPLPRLTSDGSDIKVKEICKPLGLSVRGLGGEHTPIGPGGICDISPSARFCISEAQIITTLYNGIKLLKEAEDALPPK